MWPERAVKIYDLRFVDEPLPGDVVVSDLEEKAAGRRHLQGALRRARKALRVGVRRDLSEVRAWVIDLSRQVWAPRRCVLVKRPVR